MSKEVFTPNDFAEFEAWKQSPEGKAAAARADKMTREEKIAEIMRILMTLAGEPEEAIRDQMQKCMKGGAENE